MIDPVGQMRLLLPFSVLFAMNLLTCLIVMLLFRSLNIDLATRVDLDSQSLSESLRQFEWKIAICLAISLLTSGLVCLILWVRYSRNIFGSAFALNRHLQLVLTGQTVNELRLRKNDEFQDLANNINEIAKRAISRQP